MIKSPFKLISHFKFLSFSNATRESPYCMVGVSCFAKFVYIFVHISHKFSCTQQRKKKKKLEKRERDGFKRTDGR